MKFYPVIIPTLCRYTHFKRCIESLSNATRSNEIDCYIALDYPLNENHWQGYLKIKEYLKTCNLKFHKLIVIEREKNYGAFKNLIDAKEQVTNLYDSFILSEDDNEFSPCFLDYMIKCLEKYRDDNRIYSVCGYATPEYETLSNSPILFTLGNSAYGVGYWIQKEMEYLSLGEDWFKKAMSSPTKLIKLYRIHRFFVFGFTYCLLHDRFYGDGMRSCFSYLESKIQIRPRISLVRNWGCDGSGLHSGYDPSVHLRKLSTEKTFDLKDDEPVVVNRAILNMMEKEAGSKRLKTRIHQEVGAILYPLLYMMLRLLKIK